VLPLLQCRQHGQSLLAHAASGHGACVLRLLNRRAGCWRWFAEKPGQSFATKGDEAIADFHLEETVERLKTANGDDGAGHHPQLLPAAQALGVIVLCLPNPDALAGAEATERLEL